MRIFPAIDLYEGKAVRLYKGDYRQMTVYSERPEELADEFLRCGATCMHVVDLEGAKSGETPNLELIRRIRANRKLFVEVGGGIRTLETAQRYLDSGIDRVIFGSAAVTNPEVLEAAVAHCGERIAAGVDIRDGMAAIHGWQEETQLEAFEFCHRLEEMGVQTIICTDISRDGAMQGTNRELYARLSAELKLEIIASGGVSTLDDVRALKAQGLSGAIIGKAYYTGAIDLHEAIEVAK